MKHSKARNELPEQVRTRVEEAKKKLNKPHGRSSNGNDFGGHSGEGTIKPAVALPFPEFPRLELTILRTAT
jgi:hypothetical protein